MKLKNYKEMKELRSVLADLRMSLILTTDPLLRSGIQTNLDEVCKRIQDLYGEE